MKGKWFLLGLAVIVLSIGFVSCTSMMDFLSPSPSVETETSKMLLDAANDILLTRESGMLMNAFAVAMERQVPGLKVAIPMGQTAATTTLTYEGRTYKLECTGQQRNVDNMYVMYLMAARSCFDTTKD